MMKNWIAVLSLGLWVATAAVAGFFFVKGHTAPGSDGRTSILLEPGERDFVLGEMRSLLAATRDIITALAKEDAAAFAKAARSIGMSAAGDAPPTVLAKLPLEFKRMAMPLHKGFDDLAQAAESGQPVSALAAGLAEQLDRCDACHRAYRFN